MKQVKDKIQKKLDKVFNDVWKNSPRVENDIFNETLIKINVRNIVNREIKNKSLGNVK